MERQMKKADRTQLAQEYIERIMEINRRHGMGDRVSEETYDRAVEKAARALTIRRPEVLRQLDVDVSPEPPE